MANDSCVFCKIISGGIPSAKVYEDDLCYAFEDIEPAAKTHVLVIPKKHVESLSDERDEALLGHLLRACAEIAAIKGIGEDGYRVVANTKENAGQTVAHLHFHVLGGELLGKMC